MAKPAFSLANTLIHAPASHVDSIPRDLRTALNFRLREAKRFVLTEEAAVRVGEAIASYPEMLVEHGQFARPPFDNCWIEFPSQKFHNAIVPGSDKLVSEMTDTHVGYLFSNGRAYVGATTGRGDANFSPFAVDLNMPSDFQTELDIANGLGVSRMALDDLYWGTTMARNLPREIVRAFRAQHRVILTMTSKMQEMMRKQGEGSNFIHGCAGEIRNIVGLLLMLNQPRLIKYIGEQSQYRAVTHRGTRQMLGHSVIELDLDRKPKTVILGRPQGTHASPRRHEVMGNYAHRNLSALCEHYWEPEDDNHWTCANCGGRRWWRKAHQRGDASLGIMTQERHLVYDGA